MNRMGAVFLALMFMQGCAAERGEPVVRGKEIIVCREAFDRAVEGYVPILPSYSHAVSIMDIITIRLDEVAVELENHLSVETGVFVKIMVDHTDFDSVEVSVPAESGKSVAFKLPVTVLEADSIIAVIEPVKPPGLPAWEAELDFGQRDMVFEAEDFLMVPRADFAGLETGCPLKWKGLPGISIDAGDEEGISAEIHTAWDGEYFYLAASVRDEKHFNTRSGGAIWDGDSFQFGVLPPDGAEAFNLCLALARGEISTRQYRGPDTALLENSEYSVVRDDESKQTFYELKMPLERLRIPPEKGVIFGFSAVVFDDDDGQGHDYWIQVSPGVAGGWDPGRFRRSVLGE